MLPSGHTPHFNANHEVDSIHNYYENLVIQYAHNTEDRCRYDSNFLADVACVALNHLPPRYIRHDVDLTFFLSPTEMQEIEDKVAKSVREAIDYVNSRESEASEEEAEYNEE